MKKRMLLMLLAMGLFIGVIGYIKYSQIRQAMGGSWAPPPEAVTTAVARVEEWPATLSAIGSVAAVNGVVVSADMPGVVESISFESGGNVKEGAVLVRLDSRTERAQLASAEAALHLAQTNFDRAKGLRERNVMAQAEFDTFEAQLRQAEAQAGEIRATIDRKTIRAPFSGVLGIREVNLGQYLNGGDPVVPLQALDKVHVNFTVPQQQIGQLAVGVPVEVQVEGPDSLTVTGRITAINSIIDEATRNIEVQATFDNRGGILRPGMFVETSILLGDRSSFIALPASAISYAPYGNSVFIVENMNGPDGKSYLGVKQQFVTLGESRGDLVAVLTGLEPGTQVVTSGVFKLRTGAAVEVNNQVRPADSASPKPEDS